MKRMDAMYICTTPFQIMSAISLALENREKADIYIDPQFENAEELGERIRSQGIFDSVVVLKDLESIKNVRYASGKLKRYKSIMSIYGNLEKAAGEILLKDRTYRRLYATHNVFIANILVMHISRMKIKTSVIYYDDGEGSYYNAKLFQSSLSDRVVKRAVLRTRKLRGVKKYYMYSPELFGEMHPENTLPVHRLPNFNRNPRTAEILKDIFGITDEKGITEPVVILDVLKDEVLPPEEAEDIIRRYGRLQEVFGSDRIMIKQHPRDTYEYGDEVKTFEYRTLPFETICLASDIQDKMLITLFSTATIMPKLLLDAEPETIFLYHLYHDRYGNDESRDRFFEALRKTYRDPEKIHIPDTEEELEQIIEKIRERIR